MKKLLIECDYVHNFCPGATPCPYCNISWPPRYEDGKFAPWKLVGIVRKDQN